VLEEEPWVNAHAATDLTAITFRQQLNLTSALTCNGLAMPYNFSRDSAVYEPIAAYMPATMRREKL